MAVAFLHVVADARWARQRRAGQGDEADALAAELLGERHASAPRAARRARARRGSRTSRRAVASPTHSRRR